MINRVKHIIDDMYSNMLFVLAIVIIVIAPSILCSIYIKTENIAYAICSVLALILGYILYLIDDRLKYNGGVKK